MPMRIDLTGQRFGHLTVIERAPNKGVKTEWRCRCDCGSEVTARTNNLRTGNTRSCGCGVIPQVGVRREEVGYTAAHWRLMTDRGPASAHRCVDCGAAPARDWSYEGGDPDESAEVRFGRVIRYSLDPDRYAPRCRSCHKKKDIQEAGAA